MCSVCIFFLMIRRPPRSTRTDTLFPYTSLFRSVALFVAVAGALAIGLTRDPRSVPSALIDRPVPPLSTTVRRSEEHTSELQSLMCISYAVFCLKKKTYIQTYLYPTLILLRKLFIHYTSIRHDHLTNITCHN